MWDKTPWGNDAAADWFGTAVGKTSLPQYVEEALKLDPGENLEVVRAAAAVLILLGRPYTWPIQSLEQHVMSAISALQAIRQEKDVQADVELAKCLDHEIAILRTRLPAVSKSAIDQESVAYFASWAAE
jgi:hypothetical protein